MDSIAHAKSCGSLANTDAAELLLTVESARLCFATDRNNANFSQQLHFYHNTAHAEAGSVEVEGQLLVLQVLLDPTTSTYGCILNINETNVPVVNTTQLTSHDFIVGPPGTQFRITLSRTTDPSSLRYLSEVLLYYGASEKDILAHLAECNDPLPSGENGMPNSRRSLDVLSPTSPQIVHLYSPDEVRYQPVNYAEPTDDDLDNFETVIHNDSPARPVGETYAAQLLYMTSQAINWTGTYVTDRVCCTGASTSESLSEYFKRRVEQTEFKKEVHVATTTHTWLGRGKYASGTLVRLTRGVVSRLKDLCERSGRGVMGSRLGKWMEGGKPGGRRHAIMSCVAEGLIAYGSVYQSFGDAGQNVLGVSSDGLQNLTRAMYGEDAGKAARATGSITKDLGEMAYHGYSLGFKTTVKSFGKGMIKGL